LSATGRVKLSVPRLVVRNTTPWPPAPRRRVRWWYSVQLRRPDETISPYRARSSSGQRAALPPAKVTVGRPSW